MTNSQISRVVNYEEKGGDAGGPKRYSLLVIFWLTDGPWASRCLLDYSLILCPAYVAPAHPSCPLLASSHPPPFLVPTNPMPEQFSVSHHAKGGMCFPIVPQETEKAVLY